ncbi:hypothetical protein BJV77DRAFT_1031951 [Russula vinacea]|nr:hypothetical protein BJV77DRAFT_1031951 [Russula vinacea]
MPVENNKRINEEQDVDLSDTSAVTAVCRIEVNVGPGGPNEIEINLNAPEGYDPKVTLKFNHIGHRISRGTQTEAQVQQSTQRRSKRICTSRAIGTNQEVEECAATDCCYDPLSDETKVELSPEEWFCDVYCRQNAGQPVRKRRRIGITA